MNRDTPLCLCEGWFEQDGLGRQPMLDLKIAFKDDRLRGSGIDVVGLFTLAGVIEPGGAVKIRKQYIGQHGVDYVGAYDGEGTLSGEWHLFGMRGRWMILVSRLDSDADLEIPEFVPPAP